MKAKSLNLLDIPKENTYQKGEKINLFVNKLTSSSTQIPIDYYQLPFCRPRTGTVLREQNFGQFLVGDRIRTSPYEINVKEDTYCKILCATIIDNSNTRNKVQELIHSYYHHNWILDDLPFRTYNALTSSSFYKNYIGFINQRGEAHIYNHFNIEIEYNDAVDQNNIRIVGLVVQPFSIRHRYNLSHIDDATAIVDPISSCDPSLEEKEHTNIQEVLQRRPQDASGTVLFTYDVIWKQKNNISWSQRWETYLFHTRNNCEPFSIHLYCFLNNLMVYFVFVYVTVVVYMKKYRHGFSRYHQLVSIEEKVKFLDSYSWKCVHADVFKPPKYPMMMAVACGTGIHLLCTTTLSLIILLFSYIDLHSNGSILQLFILTYMCMSGVSGYISGLLFRLFQGKKWKRTSIVTAVTFPGTCFIIICFCQISAFCFKNLHGMSYTVPSTTLLTILLLCFVVSTPLVMIGSYFGHKYEIKVPVDISNTHSTIPDQPWFMHPLFAFIISGVLRYSWIHIEVFFVMIATWFGDGYDPLGCFGYFILITLAATTIANFVISILQTFMDLQYGNYHWWWRSFFGGASMGIFHGFSSIFFARKLQSSYLVSYFIYFGISGLLSLSMTLMTGSISVLGCLWFNLKIFGTIKG